VPTSHVAVEIGGGAGLHYHYGTLGQLEHGVNHAEAYLRSLGKEPKARRPLASWPYSKGSPVRLFVFAGHRNMEGERAFVQQLAALKRAELQRDDERIAFRYSLGGGHKVSAGFEALGPAGCYGTFGPELSFARRVASEKQGNIAIAKFTHTGSQSIDWTPAGSEAPARNLYPRFVAFVQEAMRDLAARGHEVELAAVCYHLSENDVCFAPYRRQMAAALGSLVRQSRVDLGLPELAWFVSQQRPADEEGLGRIDITADLEKLAASDPRLRLIKAYDLPGQEEKLVLTTAGVVALGELLAREFLRTQ
jgi:hypothetical protein